MESQGFAPGGTKCATSANMSLLRLQRSEGKFTMSCEIEPVRRSFCRRRSCTFTEVARFVPSCCWKRILVIRPFFVRTSILHLYGFDSIGILFSRGEIPQNADNAPEISTRRTLGCELPPCKYFTNR